MCAIHRYFAPKLRPDSSTNRHDLPMLFPSSVAFYSFGVREGALLRTGREVADLSLPIGKELEAEGAEE